MVEGLVIQTTIQNITDMGRTEIGLGIRLVTRTEGEAGLFGEENKRDAGVGGHQVQHVATIVQEAEGRVEEGGTIRLGGATGSTDKGDKTIDLGIEDGQRDSTSNMKWSPIKMTSQKNKSIRTK